MAQDTRIMDILQKAKKLAQQYRALTGKPLGIPGEVAEYEAARILGIELTPARQAGYDAVEKKRRRSSPPGQGQVPAARLQAGPATWVHRSRERVGRRARCLRNLRGVTSGPPTGAKRAGIEGAERTWRAEREQVQEHRQIAMAPLIANLMGTRTRSATVIV